MERENQQAPVSLEITGVRCARHDIDGEQCEGNGKGDQTKSLKGVDAGANTGSFQTPRTKGIVGSKRKYLKPIILRT